MLDVAVELARVLADELVAFAELDGGIRAPDHGFDGLHGEFGWFGDMGIVVV